MSLRNSKRYHYKAFLNSDNGAALPRSSYYKNKKLKTHVGIERANSPDDGDLNDIANEYGHSSSDDSGGDEPDADLFESSVESNDSSDEEEENDDPFGVNENAEFENSDKPIFEGSTCALGTAILLISSFVVRHSLSWVALQYLLNLIKLLFP